LHHISSCKGTKGHKATSILLAGNSTRAAPSGCRGGSGNGFFGTLVNGAIGKNVGHNGGTVVSFVSGGDWKNVSAGVKKNKASYSLRNNSGMSHLCSSSCTLPFGRQEDTEANPQYVKGT